MGDLDHDTRLEGADGTYTATVSPEWEIWGPNGGYMATFALRAAGAVARIARPVSFYGHFLRVAEFASIEVVATPVQQGRRAESIRVSIAQGGKAVFEGLLRTALEGPGLEHEEVRGPEVPPPEAGKTWEECIAGRRLPSFAFWNNVEARVVEPDRFVVSGESRAARLREWYRFRPRPTFDDPFVDAARSLILIDTLGWPAAWRRHAGTRVTAPSLDVAVFFHRSARHSEWLLAEHTSPIGAHGLIGAEGRIYDREGRILASGAAQLLCLPAPDGTAAKS
jgi:acyl-CoA thioesterase-2